MKSIKYFLAAFFLLLCICSNAQDVPPVTVNVTTAGTLSSLISSTDKYLITDLTLSGNLNEKDIAYLKEMCQATTNNISINLSKTSVIYGSTANYLPVGAFTNCAQLKSIILPDNLNSIGSTAFLGCIGLKNVVFTDNLKYIYSEAFSGCVGINNISLNSLIDIGDKAFYNCTGLTEIDIPSSVIYLRPEAFSGCINLTTVRIEESDKILYIQNDYNTKCKVFNNCPINFLYLDRKLDFDMISNGSPYASIFNPTTLQNITLGNKITEIQNYLLASCSNIKSIIIPETVTRIGNYAFMDCSKISSITIPSSVTTIGASAFYGMKGLTALVIPNSVMTLEIDNSGYSQAFKYCTNLLYLSIGSGISKIGNGAFWRCENLTNITIPKNITTIGNDAFYNCIKLNDITLENGVPPTVGSTAFGGIAQNTTLHIPKGSKESYLTSNGWKDFPNIVEIVPYYSINSSSNSGGTVTANSSSVKEGESVTFIFTPNQGYEVISTTFNGKDITSEVNNNTYTVSSVSEDITLVATFGVVPQYGMTATYSTGGNVYINEAVAVSGNNVLVNKNTSVTFKIEPEPSYTIEKVTLNNQDITSQIQNNSYSISSVTQNQVFNVTFKKIALATTVTTGEGGKASLSSSSVDYGNSVTLTITPNEGYVVDKATMNGTDITASIANNAYTATAVKVNIEFVIIFKMNTAIPEAQINNIKVYTDQDAIIVAGADLGDNISVYTESGALLQTIKVTDNTIRMAVPGSKIYFIKTTDKTFKVAL